eukprot:SAG11_NODE_19896_length_456_cov_14.549020_1_plen_77_part_10
MEQSLAGGKEIQRRGWKRYAKLESAAVRFTSTPRGCLIRRQRSAVVRSTNTPCARLVRSVQTLSLGRKRGLRNPYSA